MQVNCVSQFWLQFLFLARSLFFFFFLVPVDVAFLLPSAFLRFSACHGGWLKRDPIQIVLVVCYYCVVSSTRSSLIRDLVRFRLPYFCQVESENSKRSSGCLQRSCTEGRITFFGGGGGGRQSVIYNIVLNWRKERIQRRIIFLSV